jgi:hypothetical protein
MPPKKGKPSAEEEAAQAAAEAEAAAAASRRAEALRAASSRPQPDLSALRLTEKDRSRAEEAFRAADLDKSGFVDRGELASLLRRLGLRLTPELFDKYVDRAVLLADVSADGVISRDEFVALFSSVLAAPRFEGEALRLAAGRGQLDLVEELLARGCDPNFGDASGRTAMHVVADTNQLEALETLRRVWGEEDVDVDCPDKTGWTPLAVAVSNGFVTMAQRLLEWGADPGSKDSVGRTPLHHAAANAHPAAVPLLASHGAAVDAADAAGWTPMHVACLYGSEKVVDALAAAGADPRAVDGGGRPPQVVCHADAVLPLRKALRTTAAPATG